MTDGQIEFLDEPDSLASPVPVLGSADRRVRFLLIVSVIGWAAAAVLAVVAPFRALYRSASVPAQLADYLSSGRAGVDGWGRSLVRSAGGSSGHGVPFGIALVACAAVLAALVCAAAVPAMRAAPAPEAPAVGRLRRIILVGAIGAPCLLAGVVGMLALYVHSALTPPSASDGFTRYVPVDVYTPTRSPFSSSLAISFDDYTVGGCLWLALGALGCAVVAAITCLVAYRTLAAVDEPPAASGRL